MTKLICIAGGSGSGKSTLAEALAERLGAGRASVLALDDFQKTKEEVPLAAPSLRRNYDHPSAVDFRGYVETLTALKEGRDVTVRRRRKTKSMEAGVENGDLVPVAAREFVLAEGYLALHDRDACALYDAAIFLRASRETRVGRRRWVKDREYVEEVLLPMHDCFVEPSAERASLTIDIDDLSPSEVCAFALAHVGMKCGA